MFTQHSVGLSVFSSPTFKEDKFAVVPLIGCVDVAGQADPEDGDGHGVVIQDPVPAHTPEPAALTKQGRSGFTITISCSLLF